MVLTMKMKRCYVLLKDCWPLASGDVAVKCEPRIAVEPQNETVQKIKQEPYDQQFEGSRRSRFRNSNSTYPEEDWEPTNRGNLRLLNERSNALKSTLPVEVETYVKEHPATDDEDKKSVVVDEEWDAVMGDTLFEMDPPVTARSSSSRSGKTLNRWCSFSQLAEILLIRFCPICDAYADSLRKLLDHMSQAHTPTQGNIACPREYCNEALNSIEGMLEHFVRSHMTSVNLCCVVCKQRFLTPGRLKRHLEVHRAACIPCGRDFDKFYFLEDHMKEEHANEKGNLCCPFCPTRFQAVNYLLLLNHIGQHYGMVRHRCQFCNSAFKTDVDLVSHLTNFHVLSKSVCCPLCSKYKTASPRLLVYHWLNACGDFRCVKCKKRYFSNLCSMQNHKRVCGISSSPFWCPKCDAEFKSKPQLQSHVHEQHGSSETRLKVSHTFHKCFYPDCKFLAHDTTTLEQHVATIHAKGVTIRKPRAMCTLCGLVVSCTSSLLRHQIVRHKFESDFQCEICDTYLHTENFLKIHKKQHHATKGSKIRESKLQSHAAKYSCTKCNYTTNSRAFFRRHEQSKYHKGKQLARNKKSFKSQKCPLCDFKTCPNSTSKALERHLFVHYRRGETIPQGYNVSVYKCELCNHETSSRGHVNRHMVVHVKKGERLPPNYVVLQDK